MTITTVCQLWCDGCGREYRVASRPIAAADGWQVAQAGGVDLCPACIEMTARLARLAPALAASDTGATGR